MAHSPIKDIVTKNPGLQKRHEKREEHHGGSPATFKSPLTIGGVGYGYKPFTMKASGPKYNNSPIHKNFGTSIDRGFGVDNPEMKGIPYASVGSNTESPVKFFGAIKRAVKGVVKKVKGTVDKAIGGAKKHVDKTLGIGGGEKGGAVAPHGDEAHTGGGAVGTGEGEAEGSEPTSIADVQEQFLQAGAGMDRMLPGVSPPPRVPNPFGGGGFSPFGGGGFFSDIRLKENITKTGISPSGIPIYEFNYIGNSARYSGAMAQDLLGTEHVSLHDSGFYVVNYDGIDVDMKTI
jgi:hypothetical protein